LFCISWTARCCAGFVPLRTAKRSVDRVTENESCPVGIGKWCHAWKEKKNVTNSKLTMPNPAQEQTIRRLRRRF
jgi:hypothetical protein